MTQLIKQSWTSYPNTFFSDMPLLTYQQVEVRRKHVQVLLLWNKRKSLQSIIEYCKLSHGEETLKYRQLVLDENTGIQRYQTKIHDGVVPSNLTKYGKCITVNDGLTYIFDKESNKKKLNTPVKDLRRAGCKTEKGQFYACNL